MKIYNKIKQMNKPASQMYWFHSLFTISFSYMFKIMSKELFLAAQLPNKRAGLLAIKKKKKNIK